MAKGHNDETKYRHTVSFSPQNVQQQQALATYEDLLPKTDANSLGTLFTKVLVLFAKQASDHPNLNLEIAQSITADELSEFLAWKRSRQASAPSPPPASAPPAPKATSSDAISIDFGAL